jgi:hypothetical protein
MKLSQCGALVLLAAWGLLSCGGCATNVNLKDFQPASGVTGGSGAVAVAPPTGPVLEKSSDGTDVIGDVKDGYGTTTAVVTTHDSVPQWVSDAIVQELRATGFAPVVQAQAPPGVRFAIQTNITEVHVADDPGFVSPGQLSAVNLRLTLVRDGVPVKAIDVHGIGNVRSFLIQLNGTAAKEQALRSGLQAAIAKAMPEIVSTFK